MRNAAPGIKKLQAGDKRLPAARAGWEDARNGRPFDPLWVDHPSRAMAGVYENWRMRAVEARSYGVPLPAWRTLGAVPSLVWAAFASAENLRVAHGKPSAVVNGQRMPEAA